MAGLRIKVDAHTLERQLEARYEYALVELACSVAECTVSSQFQSIVTPKHNAQLVIPPTHCLPATLLRLSRFESRQSKSAGK